MESVSSEIETPAAAHSEADPRAVPEPEIYERPIEISRIDPDAVKVLRRLARYGHTAYLVGGGVRDLLLDRQPKDFDVATSARPGQVRDLFRNCRVIGRRFRLAAILFAGGKKIEVATFRRDPGQGFDDEGGDEEDRDLLIRQDNVFGEPHEDARRRDFTINGLFYDIARGVVIDYVGGSADLESRVVRTIGDPDVRLREDPVRMLRAIKFSARLDLGIAPELYDAILDCRSEIDRAARPRVLEEVLRLLRGGASHRSFYLTWDTGVLAEILPELASYLDDVGLEADPMWRRLDALDRRIKSGSLPSDAVLMAALLLGPIREWIDDARDPSVAFEDFFDDIALRLAVPRRLKDRVRSIVIAQRRLETGKLGALPRREFFPDAATLFAISCEANGERPPPWAQDPGSAESGPEPGRRRRRRRRR
jgi:poly(A) polymerase